VDRHVSECERGICEQEERIADMDRRGHDRPPPSICSRRSGSPRRSTCRTATSS
jgi:hypothetical protein